MKAGAWTLCLALTRAQSRLALAVDEALAIHHGLCLRDLALLDALQQAPAATLPLRGLAAACAQPLSTTLRQALPLEKTGLLERGPTGLALRPAGSRLLKQAQATADEAGTAALAAMPASDGVHLLRLLSLLVPTQPSLGAPS